MPLVPDNMLADIFVFADSFFKRCHTTESPRNVLDDLNFLFLRILSLNIIDYREQYQALIFTPH